MRVLDFIVDKQIIKENPNCDFTGLVPGTEGYLKLSFSFSSEWDGCTKVVGFWNNVTECQPQVLNDDNTCIVPVEASKRKNFKIQVLGKKRGVVLTTNRFNICQDGR